MREVILLNGPPGVGKSTVARLIAALVPGTVSVSGDAVRRFAPPDARRTLGPGSTYCALAALVRCYLSLGAPRVVADYVFTRPAHIERTLDGVPSGASVAVLTLWAELPAVVARAGERESAAVSPEAVEHTWRELSEQLPRLGTTVDASGTIAATVARIEEALRSDRSTWILVP